MKAAKRPKLFKTKKEAMDGQNSISTPSNYIKQAEKFQ